MVSSLDLVTSLTREKILSSTEETLLNELVPNPFEGIEPKEVGCKLGLDFVFGWDVEAFFDFFTGPCGTDLLIMNQWNETNLL
jgi:hypothetical protein